MDVVFNRVPDVGQKVDAQRLDHLHGSIPHNGENLGLGDPQALGYGFQGRVTVHEDKVKQALYRSPVPISKRRLCFGRFERVPQSEENLIGGVLSDAGQKLNSLFGPNDVIRKYHLDGQGVAHKSLLPFNRIGVETQVSGRDGEGRRPFCQLRPGLEELIRPLLFGKHGEILGSIHIDPLFWYVKTIEPEYLPIEFGFRGRHSPVTVLPDAFKAATGAPSQPLDYQLLESRSRVTLPHGEDRAPHGAHVVARSKRRLRFGQLEGEDSEAMELLLRRPSSLLARRPTSLCHPAVDDLEDLEFIHAGLLPALVLERPVKSGAQNAHAEGHAGGHEGIFGWLP
ncbi:hypothetical protein PG987_008107 [Apiospora arundinis]